MSHGFCGSGIQMGHSKDKLSLFPCLGPQLEIIDTGGREHHKACKCSIWRLLLAGGLAGAVSWRTLTWPHRVPGALSQHGGWVPVASGGGRAGRSHIAFYAEPVSHTVSFRWLRKLQRCTCIQGEGTRTPPLHGVHGTL